jgi:hypothetical protein
MIRGNPSIPERVPILEYPTPRGLEDVILRERRDMRKPSNSQFSYGDPHPDTAKYPAHFLARVMPDPELGWAQWIYLKTREQQNLYNWESNNQPDWPVIRQSFVILREEYDPIPANFEAEYPFPEGLFEPPFVGQPDPADDYYITSVEQSRSGDAELDSLFVIVTVTREKLVPLEGEEFDSETGQLRPVTREKVPAGTPGAFDPDTGTITEVTPINSLWSMQTIKQASGLAGQAVSGTASRSFPEIVQYAWPAVLSSWEPYSIVSVPLRAGGYEPIVTPNMLRYRYSGPCVSEVVETWTKNPPAAIVTLGVPVPEAIQWRGKLYNLDVEPTLHAGFELSETSGTNHPDYKYYYYRQYVRATNYVDWPNFVITDQQTQPYMGGYLTRMRKIYNPYKYSLSGTVLLSVTGVTSTSANLQWVTGLTTTASVYVKTTSSGTWTLVASGLTGSAYTVTGLSSLTSYDFKVVVGSTTSNIATLTTQYAIPVVTSGLSATAQQGSVFAGYTITATGPATSFAAAGLPTGLTVNATTGAISGTPTGEDGGNLTVEISASNPAGTGTANLVLAYTAKPHICTDATLATRTTTLAATGGKSVAFSYQLYADNSPTSFAATGLPTGLSINTTTGLISGTVNGITSNTNYTVNVTATNAAGTSTAAILTLTFVVAPVVSGDVTTSFEGNSFSYAIVVANTASSYAATGLPAGLSIDTTTGIISGVPTGTSSTTVSVTISATNAAGTDSDTLTILYTAKPTITAGQTYSHDHNSGTVNFPVVAANAPTSWTYEGTVSTTATSGGDYLAQLGVSFNTSTGTFEGSPAGTLNTGGVWVVAVSATNNAGTRTAVNVTITVTT